MAAEELEQSTSLLDAFARSTKKIGESEGAMVALSAPAPVDRVVGAQKVAVYRDEKKVLEKLKVIAAAAGTDWMYRFPVKKKDGSVEFIEGGSIKLANDLARIFGNVDIDVRVMDLGDSWIFYSRFVDLESGFSMTRPFQQRKGQRGMRTETDRALDIAFQIGASKSIRNIILNSLQSFADFAFEEARNSLVEKIGKNLEGWRERCVQRIAERKIALNRVERVVGRAVKDWLAPDIARVVAMMQSIADGMASVDEVFPPLDTKETAAEASSPATTGKFPSEAGEGGEQGADVAAQTVTDDVRDPAPAEDIPQAVVQAYEQGKQAKAKGARRTAVPGEFRTQAREHEQHAWFAGYDGLPIPE